MAFQFLGFHWKRKKDWPQTPKSHRQLTHKTRHYILHRTNMQTCTPYVISYISYSFFSFSFVHILKLFYFPFSFWRHTFLRLFFLLWVWFWFLSNDEHRSLKKKKIIVHNSSCHERDGATCSDVLFSTSEKLWLLFSATACVAPPFWINTTWL